MPRGPEGQTGRGAFSFGYFSLGMQRKVTRQQGETKCLITRKMICLKGACLKQQTICVLCGKSYYYRLFPLTKKTGL
jgi:hypothetical protein